MWFRLAGDGREYSLDLCGSEFDTVIAVFSGSCDELQCVAWNDDFLGCDFKSKTSVCAAVGTNYYIAVGGFDGDTGNYELVVTDIGECIPRNNALCDEALPTQFPNQVFLSTIDAEPRTVPLEELVGELCSSTPSSDRARWYTITGTGGDVTVSTCGSCMDTVIGVWSYNTAEAACSDMYCVAFNDDTNTCDGSNYDRYDEECEDFSNLWSSVTFCSTFEIEYVIMVAAYGAGAGEAVLTIDDGPDGICVGNDECFAAIPLAPSDFGTPILADTFLSTGSSTDRICEISERDHSVWYRVEGTGNEFAITACMPEYNMTAVGVSVFSSTTGGCRGDNLNVCVGGAEINSDGDCDEAETFCSVAGESYWIMLDSRDEQGYIDLRVDELGPCSEPENSLCRSRERLATPGNSAVSASGSTVELPGDVLFFLCDFVPIVPPNFAWFSVVGNGRVLRASLCNSNFDSVLGIFEGPSCSVFPCITANDDFCGLQSQAEWCAVTNVEYMILISSYAGDEGGSFTLELSDVEPCSGTEPCLHAGLVTSFPFISTFDTSELVSYVDLSSVPITSCIGGVPPTQPITKSRWFKIVAPSSRIIHVDTCGSDIDTIVAVYSLPSLGSNCLTDLQCVAGNDNTDGCASSSYYYWWWREPDSSTSDEALNSAAEFCAVAGETYYVMVAGQNDEAGPVSLQIQEGDFCDADLPVSSSCSGAYEVPDLPFTGYGDTSSAAPFLTDICYNSTVPLSGLTWFSVNGIGRIVTASVCDTDDALQMTPVVYGGDCTGQECIASGAFECSASWCSLHDEIYRVVLMSPAAVKGDYEVNLSVGNVCIGPPRRPTVVVSEKTDATLEFSWREPFSFGFEIMDYSLSLVDSYGNSIEENLFFVTSCAEEGEYCSYLFSNFLAPGEEYTLALTATNRWGESPVATIETLTFEGDCFPAVNTDITLAVSSGSSFSTRNLLRGNVLTVQSDAILHGFEFLVDLLTSRDVLVTLFHASETFPLLFQEVHSTEIRVSSGPLEYISFTGLEWSLCKGYRYFVAVQADYTQTFQDTSFELDSSSCVGTIEHGLEVSDEYQDLPRSEFWDQQALHRPTFAMRYDISLESSSGDAPDAPVIAQLYASASSVTVKWEESCGHGVQVTSYTVSLMPASGAPAVVSGADREHVFFGLAPSTMYTIEVVATSTNGDSAAASGTVTTLATRYNLEWATQSASDGSAPGTVKEEVSVAVDSLGNSFVAGTFEDTIMLAEGVEFTTARYFTDCFVARYDASGAFLWAVHVGQSDVGYTSCNDVAVDSTGDCYVVGEFEDSITFGTGGGATTITESPGAVNMFLAKFSAGGDLLFSKHMGDAEGWYYSGFSVVVQPATDMVVAVGAADGFTDTVLYEDSSVFAGEGSLGAFVAMWNSAGALQSYDVLHGSQEDIVVGLAAAFDSFGDLYITGVYDGVVVTDDFLLSSFEPSFSIFAAKVTLAPFNVEWLSGVLGGDEDTPNAIAVVPGGDFVYIGGYHDSAELEFVTADPNGGFDEEYGYFEYWVPTDTTSILANSDPFYGPFVIALDGSNGEFVWFDTVSIEDNSGSVRGLAVLPTGIVVAGGEYYDTLTFTDTNFDGEPFVEALSPSAFLLAYAGPTADLVWSRWIGSPNSRQVLSDLSSSNGLLMATGFFEGSASLDCSTTISATVDGLQELFVAQYSLSAIPATQPQPPANICGPGTLTDFEGSLRFPTTAGESYPNGIDCFWLIEPFDVYHVLLDVTLFDLMGDDYVVFYDGSTTEADALVRYDGRNARVRDGAVEYFNNYNEASKLRVFGTQETLLVHFHSDTCLRGYGLEFSWQSAPKAIHCDNDFPVLAVLEEGFVSESPVGGYRAFADCLYVVQPTFDIDFIVAEFLEFSLAFDDCVSFYDGILITDPLLATFCGNDEPFPVQATSREMLIRFQTNGLNYDDGWVLVYRGSKEQEYCFGTDTVALAPEDGPVTFQSHAADADYQPIANCGWEVEASGAVDSVYIFFASFDVPSPGAVSVTMDRSLPESSLSRALSSNGLSQTTVEVSNESQGDETKTLYVSESSSMHLQFEAGGSLGTGFEAVVCAHPAGGACEDQVFTGTDGEFDNHFCAQFYEGNADCNWTVAPSQPDLDYVMLAFSSMDMRQNQDLGYVTDFVEVLDNNGEALVNATGNAEFYSNNNLPVVVSKEGMSVHFVSDALVAGEGFDATYCSEFASRPEIPNGCEGASILASPQGEFHNHFCGGVHAANASCSWAVDAKSSGSTAMVVVRNLFFADEPFNTLETVLSLTRMIGGPATSNTMEAGWGDNLHIYVDGELFRTFNRGGEFDDKTPPSEQEQGPAFELPIVISFVLTDLRLEFLSNDVGFVQGFDGTYCIFGPTDARICTGNSLFVEREGSLHSRACDSFYQADADCTFTLAPEEFVVGDDALVLYVTKADFNNPGENESAYSPTDTFKVFDGAIVADQFLLASYNHSAAWIEEEYGIDAFPFVHTTVKDTLTLQLVTDSQFFAEGFEAEYCTVARPVSTCGGETQVVSGESGTLRDRTCGPTFVSPMDCRWRIDPSVTSSVEPYSVLVIVFTRLDIGSVLQGTWGKAYVRISDGATEEFVASTDPRHSNFQEPQLIEGSAAFVVGPQASAVLDFEVQSNARLFSGWEIEYFTSNETGVCSAYQTFTEPTGYVEDHKYGLFYENNVECEFLVQVDGAESISVQFETFELERGFDFLEVYDGAGWEANLIGFFTGDELPQSFSSTGNSLYFVFSTDTSVVGGGFRFYYSDSSLLECPLFCSGRGTCVSAVEGSYCDCDAGRFGSGCEIPPSPVLREARFSDGLEQLVLTFNLPSNRASMNQETYGLGGSTACDLVLDAATVAALGDGSSCVWRDSQTLLVKFGYQPTIDIGDAVGIIGGVITHPNLPEPTTAAMSVLAEGPANARTPTLVIVAPSSVTPGEELVLDGRSSFLDGGRAMTFAWSAQICLEGGVTTTSASRMAWARHTSRSLSCTPVSGLLQSLVASESGPVLTVSASALAEVPLDHLVQFSAVATNFVGTASPATPSTVLYTAEQLPQVYLLGARAREVRRAEALLLRGRLALPVQQSKREIAAAECSTATFRWSVEQCSESVCPTLDEETRDSLQLYVAPESLSFGHNYTLRLDVTFVEEVGQPTTSSFVDLHVADLTLEVAIAGGDRVLSRQRSIALSAEILKPSTADLPQNGATVAYRWNCRQQSGHACTKAGGELLVLQDTEALQLAPESLPPGDYFFSVIARVNVTTAEGEEEELSSSDRISLRILRRDQTEVRLRRLGDSDRHNPRLPLALSVAVGPTDTIVPEQMIASRQWSVADGDISLISGETTLSENNEGVELVLAPRVLHGGAVYRFRVDAMQAGLLEGEAELSVEVNAPPSGGRVLVFPSVGDSATPFRFQASGATDSEEDMPLSYIFGVVPADCTAEERVQQQDTPYPTPGGVCPFVPLSNQLDVSSFEAFLPAGSYFPAVEVSDRLGASSRFVSQSLLVVTSSCATDSAALNTQLTALVDSAEAFLCLGDFDAVRQLVNVASSAVLCVDFPLDAELEQLYSARLLPLLGEVEARTATTELYLDGRVKSLLQESRVRLQSFSSRSSRASFLEDLRAALAAAADLGFARDDGAGAALKSLSRALEANVPLEASDALTESVQSLARGALRQRYCNNVASLLEASGVRLSARRRSSTLLNGETLTTPTGAVGAQPSTFTLPLGISNNLGGAGCLDYAVTQYSVTPYRPAEAQPQLLLTPTSDLSFSSGDGNEVSVSGLEQPIRITLAKSLAAELEAQSLPSSFSRRCAFWNSATQQWSSEGCTLTGEDDGHYFLEASHLTSFSVLFDGGGGGGGAAPPISISSFGTFAEGFTGVSVFDPDDLDQYGNLVSSFTQFSLIPQDAFETSDTVYQLLQYSPGDVESEERFTWDVIASMALGGAAVICFVAAIIVLSIPPIRHTLDGSRSREQRSHILESSRRQRELELLREPSTDNYFVGTSESINSA